jgi:diaminopimelate decarboxylase
MTKKVEPKKPAENKVQPRAAPAPNGSLRPPLAERNGVLLVGGCPATELAERYGTPLYVYDEKRIRENIRRLRGAFERHWKNFKLYYPLKTNSNLAILRILRQEGAGADCSNPNEIFLASAAGFRPKEMLYTGNYNSREELREALDSGATINLDDVWLLDKLLKVGRPERISFRVNVGGAGSHSGLVFGAGDTKFGIPAALAPKAYRLARDAGIRSFGIHTMGGSGVLDAAYFPKLASALVEVIGQIAKEVGIGFDFIDLGGGFGVPYKPGDQELDILRVGKEVSDIVRDAAARMRLNAPELCFEPGRYLVCDAGVILARVHHVKRHDSARLFAGTDAGMNTIIRPALYGAYHEVLVANDLRRDQGKVNTTVTGQVCENTDVLAKDRELPEVHDGDLLAVLNAGAYGFGMSSQYNNRPRAAEVLASDGNSEVIRERETASDLVARMRVPGRLMGK